MLLRTWRFLTLLLAALALTMGSAHLLELPQKLQYDPEMYSAVNTTLYRYFALVGGPYQIGSIVSAAVLVFMVRGRGPTFAWTLAGAILVATGFVVWLAAVAPVNGAIATALHTAPQTVPELWTRLRWRWELGHVASFVVHLLGVCALVISVLVETPARAWRERAA